MDWFLPILLMASLSVRTANIQPSPLDYEIAVGVEKKGQIHLSREWERQNGINYVDEEYWASELFGKLLARTKYIRKESRDIDYAQHDLRFQRKGFSAGYALRYDEDYFHRAVVGWEYDKRFNVLVARAQLTVRTELTSDFRGNTDYSVYAKPKLGVLQNLSLFGLLVAERAGDNTDFQAKIGFEVELPTIKGE